MNKDVAVASPSPHENETPATMAMGHGERLKVTQHPTVSAPTDDTSATVLRSGSMAPPSPGGDTALRLESGAVIAGRLEIGGLLGEGGMGKVYAARDYLKDQDIAIKVLSQELLFSVEAKERFLAEAKVSCNLSHPNIVRVYDVGTSGDTYYFSMERLQGHTLRQRMDAYRRDNRTFSVAEVGDIARQLIDALRYAHRFIVHRDLKPENVWLADDGTVKLMDFGIARAICNPQLTQTGMSLGTANYMAPEQRISAKGVDWRADQYALGVMLYELLTGILPTGAVQPIEQLRRDLPKRYARAVMCAMAAKPEQRFASLNDLLVEISTAGRRKVGMASLVMIGAGMATAVAGAFIVLTNEGRELAEMTATDEEREGSDGSIEPKPSMGGTGAGDSPPPEPASISAAGPKQSAGAPNEASRRAQCISQCERDDGQCRSLGDRGKQDCIRQVGLARSSPSAMTNPAGANCAFFSEARCDYAANRDVCLARMATRYKDCVNVLGDNVVSDPHDCDIGARESERMCTDTLQECWEAC